MIEHPLHSGVVPTWWKSILFLHGFFRFEDFWRRFNAFRAFTPSSKTAHAAVRYTGIMTRALDAAIARLATLPAEEQDRVANWLLEELRDEEHWNRQFATSQDALAKLAAEAGADHAAGHTSELDPEKL